MPADADLAAIGKTLGDSHRAAFLLALLGGEELSAGELGGRSGASPSLASAHLATLVDAGMIVGRRQGRHRLYRLAGPHVAEAIEGLLAIAPQPEAVGLREVGRAEAIRRARTCYDHLAGRLGVALADALEDGALIEPGDGGWNLTGDGERRLEHLGLDVTALRRNRRPLLRPCLDWTERRPHVAGGLGAAIARQMFDAGMIVRLPGSRAVRVTRAGERHLRAAYGLHLPAQPAGS